MMTGDSAPIDDRMLGRLLAEDSVKVPTVEDPDPTTMAEVDHLILLQHLWPQSRNPSEGGVAAVADAPLRRLGRFEPVRVLGQGGFGIVYLARDYVLGREVALKLPRPDIVVTADVRRRFLREARAAAALDHPNIVPVYEAGELESTCYIASTYCPGLTLASWLRTRTTPVPAQAAARLMLALADAVQHAHDHDVFHRDIKPSNVILANSCRPNEEVEAATLAGQVVVPTPGGTAGCPGSRDPSSRVATWPDQPLTPRLTDFGLARIVEEVGEESRSGVAIGSPPYMSPEQAAGRISETGPSTDVYALGATLYEVLTGRPPFRGETPTETLRMVLEEDPVSPRVLRPGLHKDLETICSKCLAKSQAQRYPTASDLRDDLGRFLDGHAIKARPLSPWQQILRYVRRKPAHALAAVLGLLLLITLLGALIHRGAMRDSYTRLLEVQVARADANARLAHRHLEAFQLRQAKQRLDAGQVERAQDILREIAPSLDAGGGLKHQFAWEQLWSRSRSTLRVLSRRREQVTSIALSADGETMATGDEDGTVRIRDPRSGDLRASLPSHRNRVYRLAFSPDGTKLASAALSDAEGNADEVLVWDLRQLQARFRFEGHGGESIQVLRFDASGERLWCNGPIKDTWPTLGLRSFRSDSAEPSIDWQGRTVHGFPMSNDGYLIAIEERGSK